VPGTAELWTEGCFAIMFKALKKDGELGYLFQAKGEAVGELCSCRVCLWNDCQALLKKREMLRA